MITSNEWAQALKPVTDIFNELGVPYYVGGSLASSAYGVARSTLDIDVVSSLKAEHIQKLVASLKERYYISEQLIAYAIERSASFNLIHLATGIKLDIFITKNRPYDNAAAARVREDTLEDESNAPKFFLAAPEDVILAKLEWFQAGGQTSERQWHDILGVLRVQEGRLDVAYLRKWAAAIGVATLLEKVLAEMN